jgi:hypothetical protein
LTFYISPLGVMEVVKKWGLKWKKTMVFLL